MQRIRRNGLVLLTVAASSMAIAGPALAKGGAGGGGGNGGGGGAVTPLPPGQVLPGNGGAGPLVPDPPPAPVPVTSAGCASLSYQAGGTVRTHGANIYRVFWSVANCSTRSERLRVRFHTLATDLSSDFVFQPFLFTWANGTTVGTVAPGTVTATTVDPVGGNGPGMIVLEAVVTDADTGAVLDTETKQFGPDFAFIGTPGI